MNYNCVDLFRFCWKFNMEVLVRDLFGSRSFHAHFTFISQPPAVNLYQIRTFHVKLHKLRDKL